MTDPTLMCLENFKEQGIIDAKSAQILHDFYLSYRKATLDHSNEEVISGNFFRLVQLVAEQIQDPYAFEIFHQSQRSPFDYYQFGLDFIRPLIDFAHSKVLGVDQINKIKNQLNQKENVILFANHQTEPDPQIICSSIESHFPELAQKMIFVAGHRVVSDPLAVPLSRGCNLLCIYSKKHMNHSSQHKAQKVLHNQKTIKKVSELLDEGGHCIYVAPSGGRDRPNEKGVFEVADFDTQSIELFWLLAKHSKQSTHFYPLSLKTYTLMPPPPKVEQQLGEKRNVNYTPVFIAFGEEINMDGFQQNEKLDKKAVQQKRSLYILEQVKKNYLSF